MGYNGSVLLSMVEDPEGAMPTIAPPGCTVIQASPELLAAFDQYIVEARSFHKVIEGYTNLYRMIVALERETFKDSTDHNSFDGVIFRNRNINTSVIYYLTSKLKESGYGLVFSEQKRVPKSNPPRYMPNYFITFDF